MRAGVLALAALLLSPAAPAQEAEQPAIGRHADEIKERYEKALTHYGAGRYSQAILEWTEILRKDPDQASAEKMIRLAREQIDKRDRDKQEEVFAHVRAGEYQKALVALQALLQRDPLHPLYQRLQQRLDWVAESVVEAPKGRKAWTMAARGLEGYLGREDDLQLAYNGLRYAEELDSKERRFRRLIRLVLRERPELERDEVTPGMTLLEFKRFVGLNQIYDGKYHLAVRAFEEVLQLEPNDVVSLKRLGSAYYALRRYAHARDAWKRALQLAPADTSLGAYYARAEARAKAAKDESPAAAPAATPEEEVLSGLEAEAREAAPEAEVAVSTGSGAGEAGPSEGDSRSGEAAASDGNGGN